MNIREKLAILADSAKYDVSCASSGGGRRRLEGGVGNSHTSGICHSWSADGRCVSLLKILLSNVCVYDCAYCINRAGNDIPRASFTPREIADLTLGFYRRNYIEGLFLSSGILKSPADTTDRILETLSILRHEYRFCGYIHVKLMPNIDEEAISRVMALADRVSTNIELPSERSLRALAPQKSRQGIFLPLLHAKKIQTLPVKKTEKKPPVTMSTQMIVGASPESDFQILNLSESLYRQVLLKRVYYSAYIPVNNTANLPSAETKPPLLREHRLYQADWLLRFYGFNTHEIVNDTNPYLDTRFDPKTGWALRNLALFPVDPNLVDKEILLRIPGLGMRSVQKILRARRHHYLREETLKSMGISLKRARFFMHVNGRYLGKMTYNEDAIMRRLLQKQEKMHHQPGLFDALPDFSAITGEL